MCDTRENMRIYTQTWRLDDVDGDAARILFCYAGVEGS